MSNTAMTLASVLFFMSSIMVPDALGDGPLRSGPSQQGSGQHARRGRSPINLNVRPGSPQHGSSQHSSAGHSLGRHGHGGHLGHGSLSLYVGAAPLYAPLWGYGGYYPAWNYSSWGPTGIYYAPWNGQLEYYLPPSYMPAELNYGPQALNRFLGVPRPPLAAAPVVRGVPGAGGVPVAGLAPVADAFDADAIRAAPLSSKLRKSNAGARDRARRFLTFGDALFRKQRFHEAAQRYRSAIETAPDMAEAYYRQGFALAAVKQYRLATKALRIAVELEPDLLRAGTLLSTLYGDNHIAKDGHLERLADKALANPRNGDYLFLVGAFLYANGEADRALKFLRRAFELAKPEGTFLLPLLAPLTADDAELDT